MSEPYRPANGAEAMDFMGDFCDLCERDRRYRETHDPTACCPILRNTLRYQATDPRYPREWIEDDSGASCTAFQPSENER